MNSGKGKRDHDQLLETNIEKIGKIMIMNGGEFHFGEQFHKNSFQNLFTITTYFWFETVNIINNIIQ